MSKPGAKPHITLHDIHFTGMEYFDWLATGLHLLAEAGQLDFTPQTTATTQPFLLHPRLLPAAYRLAPRLMAALGRGWNTIITGTFEQGGKTLRFVFDASDSPYFFLTDLLAEYDLYFKCQCPTAFAPAGFPIADGVFVPWHPDVLQYQQKIRPAMLGRPLSRRLHLRDNLRVLQNWQAQGRGPKDLPFFAYFGTDKQPPRTGPEGVLQLRFGERIGHPNPKRGVLVEGLRSRYGANADARIITSDVAARRGPKLSDATFSAQAARSWHNLNVSGFRRSLPFRFCDSFLLRACVPTDALAVRWYEPLEAGTEYVDLGALGYEPDAAVDWTRVWTLLDQLASESDAQRADRATRIAQRFDQLWHPQAFASYVVKALQAVL